MIIKPIDSTESDEWMKCTKLRGRILCGVCIEMDTPHMKEIIGKGKPSTENRKGEPDEWTFQLSRPVKLDFRNVITSYLEGKSGGKLKLQMMVRGHHRRQPYGPGRTKFKWIHIEPYWKGDKSAPIAERSYDM